MLVLSSVPKPQWVMLALIALGIPCSIVGALYPENTWLQVGPVAIGLLFIPSFLRRCPLSNTAAAAITSFILLHLLAARWSYSYVPYEQWLGPFVGADGIFGWQRNMFDRVVHFLFGVLAVPACAEIAYIRGRLPQGWVLLFAVLFVLAVSCVYEIFEWLLTLTLAPADAGAYNGEQGDRFDSQKDMALAAIGALIALPWARWHLNSLGD